MKKAIRNALVVLSIALSGALGMTVQGASASPAPSTSRAAEGCAGDICQTQRHLGGSAVSGIRLECTASIPPQCRIRR